MSSDHYSLNKKKAYIIRGTAKLLSASSARYDGDWHSVPHTHNHVEIFYIVGGKGQFLIDDKLYPVDTNNLVIINPNVVHTEVSLNAQPLEYIVLGIEGIELGIPNSTPEQYFIFNRLDSAEVSTCMRNILWEMQNKQTGYEDVCQAFMEILLIRLMRYTGLPVPAEAQAVSDNRQCVAVRRYIDNNYKYPLTLEQLAAEAHMNKYYLSHVFKREYGVSPINYMISRRIAESKHLLEETDLSASQIAQMLGFSSSSYFSQAFRRAEGISPMEHRRANKSDK